MWQSRGCRRAREPIPKPKATLCASGRKFCLGDGLLAQAAKPAKTSASAVALTQCCAPRALGRLEHSSARDNLQSSFADPDSGMTPRERDSARSGWPGWDWTARRTALGRWRNRKLCNPWHQKGLPGGKAPRLMYVYLAPSASYLKGVFSRLTCLATRK